MLFLCIFGVYALFEHIWYPLGESNPGPAGYEPAALPTELRGQIGASGRTRTGNATQPLNLLDESFDFLCLITFVIHWHMVRRKGAIFRSDNHEKSI